MSPGGGPRLPALRADLTLVPGEDDTRWSLHDPVLDRRLGLGRAGRALAEALAKPGTATAVLKRIERQGIRLRPEVLYRHVDHLRRHGALEGARAQANRRALASAAAPGALLRDLPLRFAGDLRHRCQACGSCCSATDVGPLPPGVVAHLRTQDWSALPRAPRAPDLFRAGQHDGQEVVLMTMVDDQCVFLADDMLCSIHKRLGPDAKPTPCRQFPYVFSHAGDHLDVSLQMECRAYWQARQAAGPMAEVTGDLEELLRLGAPIHAVPERVPVDEGLQLSRGDYLALEAALIAAVQAAGPHPVDLIRAFGAAVRATLGPILGPLEADEAGYASVERWQAAFPGAALPPPTPAANLSAALSRFAAEMTTFCDEAAGVARERGLVPLAQRYAALGRAIGALSGDVAPASFRYGPGAREVLRDLLVASLFGKEAIRRAPLREGLALTGLRAVATLYGACRQAKDACRVEVFEQDIVDSMVTIGKMLRDRAVVACCNELKSSVIPLFSDYVEALVAPRAHAAGGDP